MADPIWRTKCAKIEFSKLNRSLAAKCHVSNSHHEELNNNGVFMPPDPNDWSDPLKRS